MLPPNPLLHATALAGPHLPTALLRQYAAGTLAPAAQHRVEAHTLACARCADVLEGLLQTPASTTDQAVAQLQQRLRQRVQQVAPARPSQRLAARRPRWLSLQLAAAAALLLSLVAGGWWAWQQRRLAATAAIAAAPSAQPAAAAPTTVPALASAAPQAAPGTPAAAPVRDDGTPAARKIAPMPAGGMASFRENLRREATEFVPEAAGGRLSGTVQLRLTIGADGKLKAIGVLHGLRADYDAEAQRLVREGPAWVPGMSGGRRAAQQVDVAVPF